MATQFQIIAYIPAHIFPAMNWTNKHCPRKEENTAGSFFIKNDKLETYIITQLGLSSSNTE